MSKPDPEQKKAAAPKPKHHGKGWRTKHADTSQPLPDIRQERFCRLLTEGLLAPRAYKEAGYKDGASTSGAPYRTMRLAHIAARIRHIETETARARGEDVAETRKKVRARLEEIGRAAYHSGQYAVAKDCEVLIGKDVGMFRERIDHNFTWNGDPQSLSEDQLHMLISRLETGLFGDDVAAIQAARQRALAPAQQTVDVTVEVEGEAIQ